MALMWRDRKKNKNSQVLSHSTLIFSAVEVLLGTIQSLLRLLLETLKKQTEFSGTTSGNRKQYLQTTNRKRYDFTDSPRHDCVT